MTFSLLKHKLPIILAIAITVVMFSGCALFQMRDCETEELPAEVPSLEQ